MQEQEPISRLIGAARRRIKQAVGARLRESGLSPQQFWMLVNLRETPGVSVRTLAGRLRMDEPTASRVVAALVARRLIHMSNDPLDRRRRSLELTSEGEEVARGVGSIAQEVRQAVEGGFSPAEKDALRQSLLRVMENMERLDHGGTGRAEIGKTPGGTDEDS